MWRILPNTASLAECAVGLTNRLMHFKEEALKNMGITGADSGGLLDMWRGDIYRWLAETPNTPTSLRYQAKRWRGDTRLTTLAVSH